MSYIGLTSGLNLFGMRSGLKHIRKQKYQGTEAA